MYIQKPLRITKGNNSHRNGPLSLFFIIIICPVDMNVYARFDEIPTITLKDIKKIKCYGRTDGQRENSIPALKHNLRGGYNDFFFIIQHFCAHLHYVCNTPAKF